MMLCSTCGKEHNSEKRLPRGWKRHSNSLYCDSCWRERYLMRTITFPIAGPVDREWPELRDVLSTVWDQSTGLSNWLLTQLYIRDAHRVPEMKKLPPMKYTYLYPEARERFPGLPSAAVTSIIHSVERRYRAARFKLLWTSEMSLPVYRYPVPYPIPAVAWNPTLGPQNVPLVQLRLGDHRWTLRLRGGPHFRRQLNAFRQLVQGSALKTELSLYRQRASRADHRTGIEERQPGGGQRIQYRTMCKLVAWMPRQAPVREQTGLMTVRTSHESLWQLMVDGEHSEWSLNADHVLRWKQTLTRHRRRLDQDRELSRAASTSSEQHRQFVAEKLQRRMQSFCHEASAQLVRFADRLGVGQVHYEDDERRYFDQFPWHLLRQLLQDKLEMRNISFCYKSKDQSTRKNLKSA